MIEQGTVISGRYEVQEKIGTGGMSDVYRAVDMSLGREVALKVLKEEFVTDMGFVTKFRAEAMAAAGLEHPNIVNVYDVGNEDGRYYIVMEYVEGVTLKTYISKKGRLSQNELLSIAIQAGRGIEAAHNKSIIHRDIKPQNIIISKEGKVKVTDFGIARAVTSNTINADRMGSVHYSSPEQARNGYVTYQSDIYSLGIVMYEMCTGSVPFDGDTTVAIAIQHLQSEITPPSLLVPDVPISVEKIILKSTMKNPERRYTTISEMLADLKKALVSPDEDFVIIPPPTGSLEDSGISAATASGAFGSAPTPVMVKEELVYEQDSQKAPGKVRPKRRRDEYDEDDDDYDDDDEAGGVTRKMDKVVTIMGIAAAVVIILIVIYLLGSFFGFFGQSPKAPAQTTTESSSTERSQTTEMIPVPNVLGMTEVDAKKAIEDKGLVYRKIGESSSDTYEAGQVMEQNIGSDREVEPGTTIEVMVSNGAGDKPVPSVTGMTQEDAIRSIENNSFIAVVQPEYSAEVEQGRVIRQSPDSAGMAKEGDSITIYVSRGQEVVRVPSVTGMTEEQAVADLEAAGFVVDIVEESHDTVELGYVISQNPRGQAEKGSTVSLTISAGPSLPLYRYSVSVNIYDNEPVYVVLRGPSGETLAQQTFTSSATMNITGLTVPNGTIYYYDAYDRTTEVRPRENVMFSLQ